MPVNDRYPLEDVLAECRRYVELRGRKVFVEYVMLAGVNDSPEHARGARRACSTATLFKVNLIPYNPTGMYDGSSRERDRRVQGGARHGAAPVDGAAHPRPRHRGGLRQLAAATAPHAHAADATSASRARSSTRRQAARRRGRGRFRARLAPLTPSGVRLAAEIERDEGAALAPDDHTPDGDGDRTQARRRPASAQRVSTLTRGQRRRALRSDGARAVADEAGDSVAGGARRSRPPRRGSPRRPAPVATSGTDTSSAPSAVVELEPADVASVASARRRSRWRSARARSSSTPLSSASCSRARRRQRWAASQRSSSR